MSGELVAAGMEAGRHRHRPERRNAADHLEDAAEEGIAEREQRHGIDPLAAVADARVFHRSYCDQSVELYGRGGQLLATSTQIAYFKV